MNRKNIFIFDQNNTLHLNLHEINKYVNGTIGESLKMWKSHVSDDFNEIKCCKENQIKGIYSVH